MGPRSVPIPKRNCRDVVQDLRHLQHFWPLLVLFYVGYGCVVHKPSVQLISR